MERSALTASLDAAGEATIAAELMELCAVDSSIS